MQIQSPFGRVVPSCLKTQSVVVRVDKFSQEQREFENPNPRGALSLAFATTICRFAIKKVKQKNIKCRHRKV